MQQPRTLAPPGGQSSFSLSGDDSSPMTPSPLRVRSRSPFPPGGRSQIDLTGGGKPHSPLSIRPLEPVGGRSSIDITGGGTPPLSISIRPLEPVGGRSSIDITGGGTVPIPISIRPLEPVGGRSSIDITGAGSPPRSKSIRTLQPVGGRSQIDILGGTPIETEPPVSPTKVVKPVGGPSSLDLAGTSTPEPPTYRFGRRMNTSPPGGRSNLVFGPEGLTATPEASKELRPSVAGVRSATTSSLDSASTSSDDEVASAPETPSEDGNASTTGSITSSLLSLQVEDKRKLQSSVVFGDDGGADYSPRRKHITRRALAPPGGAGSFSFA
ncbi:hypothetical protein HK102_004315 [Quaeritorhiza haematococci]|nr:hypothetical protein HK102_004315 [Quaeritorhiza haematococci]